MKLEDVLNSTSPYPLSQEELEVLVKEKYIIDQNTPSRIKRSTRYVSWVSKNYPQEVGQYLLSQSNRWINDYNYKAFLAYDELLEDSLYNDFNKTISVLAKNNVKINNISKFKDILLEKGFVITGDDMLYFVHMNPEVINISLKNDFEKTVDFLSRNTVHIPYEELFELDQIFMQSNFVVSPQTLKMAVRFKTPLNVSLANDELTTLTTKPYELIRLLKHDSNLYEYVREKILNYITSEPTKENKEYISAMMFAIAGEEELLFDALKDENKREVFLKNLSESLVYFSFNEVYKKRLYDVLNEINFSIEKYDPELLFKDSSFLLSSLKNNYKYTTDYLIKKYEENDLDFIDNCLSDDISDEEYERYKEILLENNFLFNNVFITYIDNRALLVLADVDISRAITVMGIQDPEKVSIITPKLGAKLLKKITDIDNPLNKVYQTDDFYYRLSLTLNAVPRFKTYKTLSKEQAYDVLDAFNKHVIPMSFIPNVYFNDKDIMDYLDIEPVTKELLKKTAFKKYSFNADDEEKLLTSYGSKSLQEMITPLKNMKRNNISVEVMLAIKLYGMKILDNVGLNNYYLDVFTYSDDYHELGSENSSTNYIDIYNGHNRAVYEMIKTIHHEINHALQFKNVYEANFEDDEDINLYAMDDMLRNIFDDYYSDNYRSISYEYDTELKAVMLTDAFFDNQTITKSYINSIATNINYSKSLMRTAISKNGIKYNMPLEDLFELMIQSNLIDKDLIRNKYRSLMYEYNINTTPMRKYTIKELVGLVNSSSEEEKSKYITILKLRTNIHKNNKYLENREELLKLDEMGLLDKSLILELNLYNPIIGVKNEFHKYLGYLDNHFDRINKMLTKNKRLNK